MKDDRRRGSRSWGRVRTGLALALVVFAVRTVEAADVKAVLDAKDVGTVWFASAGTLTRPNLLTAYRSGPPTTLSGWLELPEGAGPFPAVVLAHGCNGITQSDEAWAAALREWGYATFLLDSFLGRRVVEVCRDPFRLTGTQRVPDAYGALAVLQTHPLLDSGRMALLGFSHGGSLTMVAATQWAKQTFVPSGRTGFRAFLAFYPSCNAEYPEARAVSAPLRLHIGEADDWTPASPCAARVHWLQAGGYDADIVLYPGAAHAFDVPGLGERYLPQVDNGSDCFVHGPSVLGPFSGLASGCLRKGAHIGGNSAALEAARSNVRRQLADLLRDTDRGVSDRRPSR
ncbi:MAG: dienelactone hydrolase family protein [Reyranellaceae bacterium]